MTQQVRLKSLRASVYRAPIETPVTTSFGIMRDRPMVLVTAEDHDGTRGWGEVWCNFPQAGAEHRARLVDSVLAPLATAAQFQQPQLLFEHLTTATAVLAIQSGEPGPFAQAIAGVDIALWDLLARRQNVPLWRLVGGGSPTIKVYASGLNPTAPEVLARRKFDQGYRGFKLKIGFGAERDIANLVAMRRELGPASDVMVDANQGWSLPEAVAMAHRLEAFDLVWLEEPLRADRPWSEWSSLKAATKVPLAAGENVYGTDAFAATLASQVLSFVQPDMAKWGGFSGCAPLPARIAAAGAIYCPHYLGGGVGLLASAHLLAAAGGPGRLEIDANDNPLRTLICAPLNEIREGVATLTEAPGWGITADVLAAIDCYRVAH